jgi:arylsulfatase A-like enzyme
VVLDGVRWQEIYGGIDVRLARERGLDYASLRRPEALMPNLHRLMDRGVALGAPGHGEYPIASGVHVSLPGYMEMFTGKLHVPCTSNTCDAPKKPTFLDELRFASGRDEDVSVITSWPAIMYAAAKDPSKMVFSTGENYGFNRSALRYDSYANMVLFGADDVDQYPGTDDHYRPDSWTAKIALRYYAAKKPTFMFLGLGDGDEYAHRLDYHGYVGALQQEDRAIGQLMDEVDAMGDRGKRTTIVVTADHGRCDDFQHHGPECAESARVWMVAAGGTVPKRGLADAKETRHLADLAPTMRVWLGLPPGDEGPEAGRAIPEMQPDPAAPADGARGVASN